MSSGQKRARRIAAGWLAVLGVSGLAITAVDALTGGDDAVLGAAPQGCVSAQIVIGYDVEYVTVLGGHAVTGLRLTGVPEECADIGLRVALLAADGRLVADVPTLGQGAARAAELETPVLASDVDAVSLVMGDLVTG